MTVSSISKGRIHVLPPEVANKIAAGEVVERPASVVKELVENALDAAATAIEIEIAHGGKSLIRVSDNGCGIHPQEARLSLERHATSKIQDAEDLFAIRSFGFRGEALPSIAAVSHLILTTHSEGQAEAVEIVLQGGQIVSEHQAPRACGTTVQVRDLFFNTPARKKFLKSDETERGHILDAVWLAAIGSHTVAFKVVSDRQVELDCPAASSRAERIRALFGKSFFEELIPITIQSGLIRIEGFIGKPSLSRVNRSAQMVFINRRPVRSQALNFAIGQGYEGLLERGRFPAAILFLELDPKLVDVNVHPTKREVRLANERPLQYLVSESIYNVLRNANLFTQVRPSKEGVEGKELKPIGSAFRPGSTQAILNFVTRQEADVSQTQAADEPPARYGSALPATSPDRTIRLVHVLGQVKQSYIVGEDEEGLFILDQHAAHERIAYEQVLKGFSEKLPESQGLLLPVPLELRPSESELLRQEKEFLESAGFSIREFGPHAFLIEAVPPYLDEVNPAPVITDFLAECAENTSSRTIEEKRRGLAAQIACKQKAVRARDGLTREEMESLIHALNRTSSPFTCPHGRPTLIRLSQVDLEKQFHRR